MKLEHKIFELKDFAGEMAKLRNEKHFDYLVTIVGEDFGEEGLGAVYILENTDTHERISVKAVNGDRDKAYIPTVSNLWKGAEILEREVYDFYGIKFPNTPSTTTRSLTIPLNTTSTRTANWLRHAANSSPTTITLST